ncbi:MAG: putative toxin-antitoxin system toxin component, PIN family [Candidatus Korobacteraceae bacterium]
MFDTNVLVSALLLPKSKPRSSFDRALRNGRLLISVAVLAEAYEVLSRKRFSRYINEEDARNFIAALTREAELVDVKVKISASRDPKDDKLLELAVSGRATHIVTGDSDLLALDPFQGIRILTPSSFLELPSL